MFLDIGSSVFTKGQAYVGLSRVKTLDGVHLINLDPSQIKAQENSIVEYNRLRTLYRPDLTKLSISRKCIKKIPDTEWAIYPNILKVQENIINDEGKKKKTRKMFIYFIPNKIFNTAEFHCEIGKGSFMRSKRKTRKKIIIIIIYGTLLSRLKSCSLYVYTHMYFTTLDYSLYSLLLPIFDQLYKYDNRIL